jgi:tight adherence protein C
MSPSFIIFIVLVFFAVAGVGVAAYTLLSPTRTSGDRLRDLTGSDTQFNEKRDEVAEKIAERLSALANPSDEEEKNDLRMQMVQAGYTNRHALEVYNAIRVVLSIGLPLIIVPIMGTGSLTKMFGFVVVTCAIGYYGPVFYIGSQVKSRQKRLMGPFPDALDMLVSSVEAGLGLDAAFRRVADEMESAAPELAHEFQYVNHEISAGLTRIEALKHLSARTGLDEVNALVNMLTQADRFGTSIARSLRVHSTLTRAKRMAKAEEEAAKVSPKLTVIMILFLMPCLMIVLIGPAVVNIKNAFFS